MYPNDIWIDYRIGGPKFTPDQPEISIKGYCCGDQKFWRLIHTDPQYKHKNKCFSPEDAVKALSEGKMYS